MGGGPVSHFVVAVVLPRSLNESIRKGDLSGVEPTIKEMLAPYDERTEVPAYQKPCWCVGRIAERAASDHAIALHGPNPYQSQGMDHWNSWKSRIDASKGAFLEARADREAPDAACDECGGSGLETTTYNPLSKWDWYRVGGRWDGFISGIDPPSSDGGFNFGEHHKEVANNIAKVDDVLARAETSADWAPFAIVTPEMATVGAPAEISWHQKGRMGWFGVTTDEKAPEDWQSQARFIFSECMDHYVVGVDCHI